tara:strand:+ start:1536 stop:2120 length:585 start_codon:yes stop_codon:yes gene_type:complete
MFDKFADAEQSLKQGLEIKKDEPRALAELGRSLLRQGKNEESKLYFQKLMQLDVEDYIYMLYAKDLIEIGIPHEEINEFHEKGGYHVIIDEKTTESEVLEHHYKEMYKILKSKDIRLVAMQFPTLSVKELENIFRDKDVILVSNEENFKEALRNGKYEDYFYDDWGMGWGHATSEGNRLIAENVTQVIFVELKI